MKENLFYIGLILLILVTIYYCILRLVFNQKNPGKDPFITIVIITAVNIISASFFAFTFSWEGFAISGVSLISLTQLLYKFELIDTDDTTNYSIRKIDQERTNILKQIFFYFKKLLINIIIKIESMTQLRFPFPKKITGKILFLVVLTILWNAPSIVYVNTYKEFLRGSFNTPIKSETYYKIYQHKILIEPVFLKEVSEYVTKDNSEVGPNNLNVSLVKNSSIEPLCNLNFECLLNSKSLTNSLEFVYDKECILENTIEEDTLKIIFTTESRLGVKEVLKETMITNLHLIKGEFLY